ncbi:MAG: hypothetical protein ACEQR8_09245 [Cypionkella sp.]
MGGGSSDAIDHARLTRAGSIRMRLIAPQGPAAHLATTFFRLECDEPAIRDVQPSSIGIFAVQARGGGHIRFLDGRTDPGHPVMLVTPTEAASTFEVAGPWRVFGAMLSPVGWAGLTGRCAKREGNRLHPAGAMLPPPVVAAGEAIRARYDSMSDEEASGLLSQALAAAARPLPAEHVRFIVSIREWLASSLSPEIGGLPARTGYSARQVQRLAERYFGLTPKGLARKYRALRAAVSLSRPEITADEIAARGSPQRAVRDICARAPWA